MLGIKKEPLQSEQSFSSSGKYEIYSLFKSIKYNILPFLTLEQSIDIESDYSSFVMIEKYDEKYKV